MIAVNEREAGFSLIEVVLALGIAAFAIIAIIGLIPIGLTSGRESIDATHVSHIVQDVMSRVRASLNSNDATAPTYFSPYSPLHNSFFYYDREGARSSAGARTNELLRVPFISGDSPNGYPGIRTTSDYYRAKIHVAVFDQTPAYPTYDPRYASASTTSWPLLTATVEIGWPVNTSDGSVNGDKRAYYTFYLRRP